jgi:hypothetical protein
MFPALSQAVTGQSESSPSGLAEESRGDAGGNSVFSRRAPLQSEYPWVEVRTLPGPEIAVSHSPDDRLSGAVQSGIVDPMRTLLAVARAKSFLIGWLLVAFAVSGCGERATMKIPSQAEQRNVAGRFAAALLRGDAAGARALLVPADDGALVFLVQQAVAPSSTEQASIRLPARRAGDYWTFSYVRRRTYRDGRFETQRGDFVVLIAPSTAGASVEWFGFKNVRTRFSTHRDSQLLPSKR